MTLTDSQKWFTLALVLAFGWLLYLLAPILTPFIVGALLAYLGDPLADKLEARRFSRSLAVVTVFSGMVIVLSFMLLLILPILENQIAALFKALPSYLQIVSDKLLPWLSTKTGITLMHLDFQSISQLVTGNLGEAGGIAANVLGYLSKSGGAIVGWMANLVLIPVVTFYLLRDWDILIENIAHLIPRKLEPEVAHIAKDSDEVLGAFLRGQVMVMVCLGTVYSLGLWVAGVKFALLIGMIAGLLSFVPYLGNIIGIGLAGVAVLFQTQDVLALLPVAAVFGVGQMLEGMVLTPLLVGDRIGLHPVMVIFAVLAGGQLFGFVGVLVALPVAAVLAVVVRDLHRRYIGSAIYHLPDDLSDETDLA